MEKLVVIDFGSQYAHLIAKRLRLLGYYTEIALPDSALEDISGGAVRGIILSGGPSSVYEKNAPKCSAAIMDADVPLLGLCYGHQLLNQFYGGIVQKGAKGEFGNALLVPAAGDAGKSKIENPLLAGVQLPSQVWMSHQDEVSVLPQGFFASASTKDCKNAAVFSPGKKRFSFQFHIEVKDTPCGEKILSNFALFCGMKKNWEQDALLASILSDIQKSVPENRKVMLFLSGGVDSTVAFALLNKALGKERVLGLHIDNGFMRKNESAVIAERYRSFGLTNFIVHDASADFLHALENLTDPQEKRKAVGETFIRVRDSLAATIPDLSAYILAQGTLYPDIIESGGSKNAHVIKTHHNRVAGIQDLIDKGLIIEPLKNLYKDEVRRIGKSLALPDLLVMRHPFPGPGLSINVLCYRKTKEVEEIAKTEPQMQAKIVGGKTLKILPVKSVGVQGDFRTYTECAVLDKADFADGSAIDWDKVDAQSVRITNAASIGSGDFGVNRVVLEIFCKTGTMQLHEAYCTKERLDQTREVDAIVLEELKKSGSYSGIFQHLTINLPYAAESSHCSIVLRPVVSEDVMTARFARFDEALLTSIVERIRLLAFVDALFYDVTNKPPATFGWE